MSKGPFASLNIYLYGKWKSGSKNTIGNRPLLRCENFYLVPIFGDTIFGVTIFEITKENFLVGLNFTGISFLYCLFCGPYYWGTFTKEIPVFLDTCSPNIIFRVKVNTRRVIKFFSCKSSWKPKTQPNNALGSRLVEFLEFNSAFGKCR